MSINIYKYGCPYYPRVKLGSCNATSVVSPSGKYTWDQIGLYLDTLMGTGGCDSIVAVEVLVDQFQAPIDKDTTSCSYWMTPNGDQIITSSGIYSFTLKNIYGCDSIVNYNLNIENCGCTLYVPNSFTPNGDGLNDVFFPVSNCLLNQYNLVISARDNSTVYATDNIKQAWDGSFMGNRLPIGVYAYTISYETQYGVSGFQQGLIYLVN